MRSGAGAPRFVLWAGRRLRLAGPARVLGVLNVTPDSFSDGGRFLDPGQAEGRALQMQDQGAAAVDVGGESTRPGAEPVGVEEELRRVLPVVRRLSRRLRIPISIDSRRFEVQRAAVDEGAGIINDVSAAEDPRTLDLAARSGATLILMHMKGLPGTMQRRPSYRNARAEVRAYLARRRRRALEAGVRPQAVVLDPGIGFGKTLRHNLALLSGLGGLHRLGSPVLVGASRKSWIGRLTGREVQDRLAGSLAAAALAAFQGADFLRVHDVGESVDAARVAAAWRDA